MGIESFCSSDSQVRKLLQGPKQSLQLLMYSHANSVYFSHVVGNEGQGVCACVCAYACVCACVIFKTILTITA